MGDLSTTITNTDQRMDLKREASDRLKTLGLIQDIDSFVVSMWQAMKIHRPSILFEPAYPNYVLDKDDAEIARAGKPAPEIPEEIITWNVIRRTPGSIDGKAFARTREIRPRVREELLYLDLIGDDVYQDPKEPEGFTGPGEIGPNQKFSKVVGMEVQGQFFDNLIQFDVWSKNGKTAESLANYIEDFMEEYHKMFIELGMVKLNFHSRVRDEFISNWRNGLVNRSLIYYIRTEKVRATHIREIKTIEINADVRDYLEENNKSTGFDKLTKDYQEQLIKEWVETNP